MSRLPYDQNWAQYEETPIRMPGHIESQLLRDTAPSLHFAVFAAKRRAKAMWSSWRQLSE